MYARNKLTGQTFLVGPTTQMIDDLGDVDTGTTGPNDGQGLVWDAALGQWVPGDVGLKYWDPFTNYEVGDQVLFPEVAPSALWQASADNYGEQPVTDPPGSWVQLLGGASKIDDLTDVDTVTGPPVEGMVLQWAAAPTGVSGPTGLWVPGTGTSEVEVVGVEPTTNIAWELWADISDPTPTDPMVLGMGMNDLTDADTASTPPIPGNVLAWSGTQWMPGIASSVDALDDLFDVDTSTVAPVDGDMLVYDAASLTWAPGKAKVEDLADVDAYGTSKAHLDVLTWDETAQKWKSYPPASGARVYRQTVAVAAFPATLTVAHGLNVATVSTTVVDSATRAVVSAEVVLTDANTATVTLTTGTVGDYEVLVLG